MPGLLRGIARTAVVAGTASAVAGRVRHRQEGRWASQEAEEDVTAQQPDNVAAPQPAAPDMNAKIDQLKQLADLKSQGVLTDAEFEAQKTRILGQ